MPQCPLVLFHPVKSASVTGEADAAVAAGRCGDRCSLLQRRCGAVRNNIPRSIETLGGRSGLHRGLIVSRSTALIVATAVNGLAAVRAVASEVDGRTKVQTGVRLHPVVPYI